MKPENFQLPEKERKALAQIFTEAMIPAIERACKRYLRDASKSKTSIPEEGQRLLEIGERARELRLLLKESRSALKRVHLHMSEKYSKHDTLSFIDDLEERLKTLDGMTFINPASDRAMNPQRRGRPAGTKKTAERALAFRLWLIYKEAHGTAAARIVNREDGTEKGPLPRATAILAPLLGLKVGFVRGDLSRYFREIGELLMDNKPETDEP